MQQPRLEDSSVLVVGIVRNGESTVEAAVHGLAAALAPARQLRWFVVESDSDDATQDALARLAAADPGFAWESQGRLAGRMPRRTERIAHCRNRCAEIARSPDHADADWVAVADLDGVNSALTAEGVASCWRHSGWDVCTASQAGPYYDIWALRHPHWCPGDCWRDQAAMVPFCGPRQATETAVRARMVTLDPAADPIEVDSAFGGFAIYRREVFDHCAYQGLDAEGRELCEHVPFHAQVRARSFRIVINPAMINAGYTEHTAILRPRARLLRGAKRELNRLARRAKAVVGG